MYLLHSILVRDRLGWIVYGPLSFSFVHESGSSMQVSHVLLYFGLFTCFGHFALVTLSVVEEVYGWVICQSFKGFGGVFGLTARECKWRLGDPGETDGGESMLK